MDTSLTNSSTILVLFILPPKLQFLSNALRHLNEAPVSSQMLFRLFPAFLCPGSSGSYYRIKRRRVHPAFFAYRISAVTAMRSSPRGLSPVCQLQAVRAFLHVMQPFAVLRPFSSAAFFAQRAGHALVRQADQITAAWRTPARASRFGHCARHVGDGIMDTQSARR